jgi:hypothetical protein
MGTINDRIMFKIGHVKFDLAIAMDAPGTPELFRHDSFLRQQKGKGATRCTLNEAPRSAFAENATEPRPMGRALSSSQLGKFAVFVQPNCCTKSFLQREM